MENGLRENRIGLSYKPCSRKAHTITSLSHEPTAARLLSLSLSPYRLSPASDSSNSTVQVT